MESGNPGIRGILYEKRKGYFGQKRGEAVVVDEKDINL